MAVRIVEIDAAAVVPVVDLAGLATKGIGPIGEVTFANASEDFVEFRLTHLEGKMPRGDLLVCLDEIERGFAHLDHRKVPKVAMRLEAQNLGEKFGRRLLVAGMHDRVVECHRHRRLLSISSARGSKDTTSTHGFVRWSQPPSSLYPLRGSDILRRRGSRGNQMKTFSSAGLAACMAFAFVYSSAPAQLAAAEPAAKPVYGIAGFDKDGADLATKPGDDFFRYANGTWLAHAQIPGDKPGYSLRIAMTDLAEGRVHQILESAAAKAEHEPTTNEGKIGAFCKSFMDEARIESFGAGPLKPLLDEVTAAKDPSELAALMGRNNSDSTEQSSVSIPMSISRIPRPTHSISAKPVSGCRIATTT